MKFSIVATVLLAQGIAAMPWSFVKGTKSNGEEVTVRIQVSGASSHRVTSKPAKQISTEPICLNVCWSEKPNCPQDWEPHNNGADDFPCWTCCREASGVYDL
ncbi:hypothetical protein NXS19_002820 [Fusarium pseudograminearum]|nr:hypothetical protein NXS19_002820 [Fusarium pseudograminearum]